MIDAFGMITEKESNQTKNSNNTVDDRERRLNLSCSFCRPNRGENTKRRPKHCRTKPKYKNKRDKI